MKTYRVKVASAPTTDTYEIEAENEADAIDLWFQGKLVHTDHEACESTVLSVEEI